MTTEEKLSNIYDIAMADAKREGQEILDAFRSGLDKAFAEHREMKNQEAADAVRDERLALQKELNKEYSQKIADLRLSASHKREEVLDRLFDLVKKRLDLLKGTPDYEAFLLRKIEEVKDCAGGENFEIRIDSSDAALLDGLSQKRGAAVVISEEDIGGGIRGFIPSRRILIDSSFVTLLSEEKAVYRFDR